MIKLQEEISSELQMKLGLMSGMPRFFLMKKHPSY